MKVLKFGGSSVALSERIKSIGSLIKKRTKEEQLTIVFSAFGGVTDQLISAAMLRQMEINHTPISSLKSGITIYMLFIN